MKYSEISEKQEQQPQWLYHATSVHNLKKIAKTGLRAGSRKRANFAGYDDHIPGKIFFSTSLDASKQWMNYVWSALVTKVDDNQLWGIIDPAYITIVMTRVPFRKVEKDDRGDGDVRGSVYSTTKLISPNLIQFWHPQKNSWMPLTNANLETVDCPRGNGTVYKPEEEYKPDDDEELTEGVIQSNIQVPQFFYRGSEMAMRSAFLTKIWRHPDPALPDNLNGFLEQGLTTHVYGLSYNLPFKISRTYSGMSNWGFGVYFASTVQWAMRYGENITCVTISPDEILAIRADDFAQEIEGTVGAAFRKKLVAKAGDSMRDQAQVIASVVRSMKRGAKALYVETSPGEGQICVFGKSAIYPKFYFEMKKIGEEK